VYFLGRATALDRQDAPPAATPRLTAAMAAGIVKELWHFERLYDEVTERTYI
jgi:hypothetical protein